LVLLVELENIFHYLRKGRNKSVCKIFKTAVAKRVCNPVIPPAPMPCTTFCFVCFYRPAFCRVCVFILWTSCLVI